ncbi:unnamed protein product [Porites evermanni]|uniref:ShKT domain-containing protein n=1 Tax=Porites evermanni TaxID=104178 RepID=A0ABN8LXG9_9CNID|nr:unnamed protein product [Porites evermanni]
MKASYEFVLLSLLVAFSWESPLNTQPPKQSVRQVKLPKKDWGTALVSRARILPGLKRKIRDCSRCSIKWVMILNSVSGIGFLRISVDWAKNSCLLSVDLEEDSIPKRAISEDSGCYDQSPSCSYWALTGQCHNNPNLQRTCCVWCNHMKTLLQVKYFSCHDKSSVHDCYRWAIQDECYKNPAFMLQFCCNSCRIEDVVIPW